LERAGFRGANAIAVSRCHQPYGKSISHNVKFADARAILATTIIEAQFTDRAPPPVITDLAHDGSVDFLPQSQAMVLAMQHTTVRAPKRLGGAAKDHMELPSFQDGPDTKASMIAETTRLAQHTFEEDYET